VPLALELTATGGTCVLAGSVSPTPGISFDPERIVRRQIAIHGVHNYLPEDLVTAVEHLASPAGASLASLAGPVFPIERVNEAMALAATPDALRVIVTP
jgi:alcohol dehydrogenase